MKPISTAPKNGKAILGYRMGIDGDDFMVIFWHDLPKSVYANPDLWQPPGWVDAKYGKPFSATHWVELPKAL